MSLEIPHQTGLKQKVVHETREFLGIFLFLTIFLEVFAAYRALLLREFQVEYVRYTAAVITALILAKIIMVGEYAGLGKKHENRPLILSTIYKAFVFGLLAVAFHVIEEVIRAVLHHKPLEEAFERLRTPSGQYEMLVRALVLFCAFVPFFAIREIRRVLGGQQLYDLFFRRKRLSNVNPSGSVVLGERTSERNL